MTSKQKWQLKGLCLLALKRGAIATTPDELMRVAVHVIRTSPVKQITRYNALWLADKVSESTHYFLNIGTADVANVNRIRPLHQKEARRRREFIDLMERKDA